MLSALYSKGYVLAYAKVFLNIINHYYVSTLNVLFPCLNITTKPNLPNNLSFGIECILFG